VTLRHALLVLALPALLQGCASRGTRVAKREEGRYQTGAPRTDGWQRVKPGGADKAWWNATLDATIYADSNCGARFQDDKLSTLADHLFYGLTSLEEVMKETFALDDRDAVLEIKKGRLDGVWVQVGAVVLNKGSCTYDFVYVSTPESYAKGDADFRAVYQGFHRESK